MRKTARTHTLGAVRASCGRWSKSTQTAGLDGFCRIPRPLCAGRRFTEQWRHAWSAKNHDTRRRSRLQVSSAKSHKRPRSRRNIANMLVRTLRAARPTQLLRCASAVPQTSPDATLKETLTAQIPQKQEELKALKAEHGSKVLGEVTVDQCIGGGSRRCGNRILGAPRASVAASAPWRGDSTPSTRRCPR